MTNTPAAPSDGSRIGRWSLRIDAIYCAALGLAVAAGSGLIAENLALPVTLIAGAGGAVVLWSAAVAWMLSRLHLRTGLRLVMTVNIFAAAAVAFVSLAAATALVVTAVLLVAFDVALFAASQAVALRRMPAAALA